MMDNRCITINYAERKLLRQPLRQPAFCGADAFS